MKILRVFAFGAMFWFSRVAWAAGLPPWEFGMTKEQVTGFKEFGPYKEFSNGDPETYKGKFDGKEANVQFFLKDAKLFRIGVYLYEGSDTKKVVPTWLKVYDKLVKDYGPVELVDPKGGENSALANREAAEAVVTKPQLTKDAMMAPAKQPADMTVTARIMSAVVEGERWYYVTVYFTEKK
jgi:hypothetical protein